MKKFHRSCYCYHAILIIIIGHITECYIRICHWVSTLFITTAGRILVPASDCFDFKLSRFSSIQVPLIMTSREFGWFSEFKYVPFLRPHKDKNVSSTKRWYGIFRPCPVHCTLWQCCGSIKRNLLFTNMRRFAVHVSDTVIWLIQVYIL